LAAVNEDAEPIDFDYFRTPVIENDVLRIVISSNDMTSYRMYDKYGIKIGGEYEAGNYDFSLNIDYTGELFIEIFCVLNAGEPCEYSLIVIGSTYVNSSINSQKSENKFFTNILTNLPYMLMALLIGFSILFVFFSKKRKRPIFSIQQNTETQNADNEIYRLKQTVIQAEIEKARIQNELEKAKETSIVQNITYNIQDSAISGDFNTSLGKSYEQ
jgi:preprotein translocase subunit SecG